MAVKFKATWRKELTWHQDIKWDVNLDKSLHSVSFPKLFLYHLDHKYAGFLTTIEEKKIKLILKGEGRKIILFFLLPFLLPPSALCWAPSTSFYAQHPLMPHFLWASPTSQKWKTNCRVEGRIEVLPLYITLSDSFSSFLSSSLISPAFFSAFLISSFWLSSSSLAGIRKIKERAEQRRWRGVI